jgi:hypothetical protein
MALGTRLKLDRVARAIGEMTGVDGDGGPMTAPYMRGEPCRLLERGYREV